MEINTPYYEDNSRVSNSSLGWFLISPRYYRDMLDGLVKQVPTSAMENGTMIHTYLLEPDEFKQRYTILDFEVPTAAQQKKFCSDYIASDAPKAILKAVEAFRANYSTNTKTDAKIAKEALEMALKWKSYIKFLRTNSSGKKVISWASMNMLIKIKENVRKHKKANELLFNITESSQVIARNEFHINWAYQTKKPDILGVYRSEIDCKSLIDRLIIDHTNRKIILADIKTTVSTSNFAKSFDEYDYGRQMAFYWRAIVWYLDNELKIDTTGYTQETCIIAIKNNGSYECRVFSVPESKITNKLKEINQILKQIDWHMDNNLWDYTKEYYEGDGVESLLYD